MNKIIKGSDLIYNKPGHVYEAFTDILERTGTGCFENITFDEQEGVLQYDVYGKHITRIFDYDQGTPEVVTDMLQWFFSMLDGIANGI